MKAPLVSFSNTSDFRRALEVLTPLKDSENSLFSQLERKGLPPFISVEAISVAFGISTKLIGAMATRQHPYYRQFQIPKRSGGQRIILAPKRFLKVVQRFILGAILERAEFPDYVMGFVPERGIITNCAPHVGAKYLLNVDLENFFPSIHIGMIENIFRSFGYQDTVARVLAGLCTFAGRLPQGAPTSPLLANLAFSRADKEISSLCKITGVLYTRYADDLSFSSDKPIGTDFLDKIRRIVTDSGFLLNSRKIRFAKPGQGKYVTGMVVNEKVQPNRKIRKRIRAIFHTAMHAPSRCLETKSSLFGYSGYVLTYDAKRGQNYLKVAKHFASRQHSG